VQYFGQIYPVFFSQSLVIQSTQTQHINSTRSFLVSATCFGRKFLPSSCTKKYRYRRKSATEENSPSQSIC